MYSCKQVAQIVSESLDKKLPFWVRMQLGMHLGMCGLCSRFRKTMLRVDSELKRRAQELDAEGDSANLPLSDNARARIRRAIDSQI